MSIRVPGHGLALKYLIIELRYAPFQYISLMLLRFVVSSTTYVLKVPGILTSTRMSFFENMSKIQKIPRINFNFAFLSFIND